MTMAHVTHLKCSMYRMDALYSHMFPYPLLYLQCHFVIPLSLWRDTKKSFSLYCSKNAKVGQLILSKIVKIVATADATF